MTKSPSSAEPSRLDIEARVLQYGLEQPTLGQFSVAQALQAQGLKVSASTVRNIWKRHGLETSYLRLLAKSKGTNGGDKTELNPDEQSHLKRERRNRKLAAKAKGQDEAVSALRREEVLLAAARIFADKGYAETSLREVAAATGMQPASLYYHFASKEDLFATVHHLGISRVNQALDATALQHDDPWQRLEEACATALKFQLNPSDLAVVVRVDPGIRYPARLQRRIDADRASYEDRFRRLIDELPLHRKADRTLLRLTLLGALNWTRVWYRPSGPLSAEDIGRQLIRIVFGYGFQRAT
ncbi:TetR/AcrR family transcriptional regulator [Pusillimonas noertemannii]|uniref:TetR/AcrR family transcriptional regulator n=1 Tax=Pusillimonas noertemannii TaxID=305977 RepID=UPI000301AEB7|nr:TetR/AcrR family transcriptional regulator [Pusillimonas noertemannii]